MRKSVVSIAAFLVVVLVGCSSDSIVVAGSSTMLPIVSKVGEYYQVDNPSVKIYVNGGGSGVGINQLGQGSIDIAMISRKITEDEQQMFPLVNFVQHAVAGDIVAVAVSSEIYDEGVQDISFAELRGIYGGEITSWSEVGGPDRDILVIDKEANRGTRHVFMEGVFGDPYARAEGADLVLGSNNEEQTAIKQSDAAIGMLSLAWLDDDVKGVAIREGITLLHPAKVEIISGAYPLVRDLYVVTNGQPVGDVADFVATLREATEIIEDLGYVSIE